MLTDAEITSMREVSTSALPDTGTITRPASGGSLNVTTGVWTPSSATTVYTGAMRLRAPTATEMTALFGDEDVTKQRYILTLPHDAAIPAVDDRVSVTTSSDDDIDTRSFRVSVVSLGSWQIDRRCGLELVE